MRLRDIIFKPSCDSCGSNDAPWQVQGMNLCSGCKSMLRVNTYKDGGKG